MQEQPKINVDIFLISSVLTSYISQPFTRVVRTASTQIRISFFGLISWRFQECFARRKKRKRRDFKFRLTSGISMDFRYLILNTSSIANEFIGCMFLFFRVYFIKLRSRRHFMVKVRSSSLAKAVKRVLSLMKRRKVRIMQFDKFFLNGIS